MIESNIFFDNKVSTLTYQQRDAKRKDLALIIAERNNRRVSQAINKDFEAIRVTKVRGTFKQAKPKGQSLYSRTKGTVSYSKKVWTKKSSSTAGGLSAKQKLSGVIKNNVEVLLKIESARSKSGKGGKTITSAKHLVSALEYAARCGKYEHKQTDEAVYLYDDEGKVLDQNEIEALSKVWTISEGGELEGDNDQTLAKRVILSMPGHSEDAAFKQALELWIKEQLYNKGFNYVYAIHNDTDNTHAHIIIKAHSIDRLIEQDGQIVNTKANKTFSPKKADLQFMRQRFAVLFNQYSTNLKANATLRQPRGVDFTTGIFENGEGKEQIRGKNISQYYAQANKRNLLAAKRRAYIILEEQGINLTSEYHEAKHHQYKNSKAKDIEQELDNKAFLTRELIINGFESIANEYAKKATFELKAKDKHMELGDFERAKQCEREAAELFRDSQKLRVYLKELKTRKRDYSKDLYAKGLAKDSLDKAKELAKEKAK